MSTETNQEDPSVPPSRSDSVRVRPEDLGIGVLFWTMRDAAVVGDTSTGQIVLWNPAAEHLFGWSQEEILGAPIELLIPDHLRRAHRTGLVHYAETGTGSIIDGRSPVEVPSIRRDGTEITIELSMTPLAEGDPPADSRRYVLALIRDASERARLAGERDALLSAAQDYVGRLEELALLKTGFTQMVAHELGTPVAAIRGFVDLLRRGVLPTEEQPVLLSAIRRECDLVGRLITDVATAAETERGDFTVHLQPVSVATLLADAAAIGRAVVTDHIIREEIEPDALATRVFADPERIGQVIRNLLGNAVKHTPPGSTVTLRARQDPEGLRIEVADTGPGIPPEDLERIFDKFGRGRDAEKRKTPGVGLGLFLARQILRVHGTDLVVTSVFGEGSVFAFTLEVVS